MNFWWTAVKWLSELCLCRVALFPLSVSAFNELLISLLYMLIWTLKEKQTSNVAVTYENWFSATLHKELNLFVCLFVCLVFSSSVGFISLSDSVCGQILDLKAKILLKQFSCTTAVPESQSELRSFCRPLVALEQQCGTYHGGCDCLSHSLALYGENMPDYPEEWN